MFCERSLSWKGKISIPQLKVVGLLCSPAARRPTAQMTRMSGPKVSPRYAPAFSSPMSTSPCCTRAAHSISHLCRNAAQQQTPAHLESTLHERTFTR